MALPFFNSAARGVDQVIAIDLGGRQTKAVHVQKKNDRLTLLGYTVQDAPARQNGFKMETYGAHLKSICKALGDGVRHAVLAVSVPEAFLRHAELPPMPIPDMRQLLKLNSKTYLQQEFQDHAFDCAIIVSRAPVEPAENKNNKDPLASSAPQKQRLLVGGTPRQTLDELKAVCRDAGLTPLQITPGLVGPANAFELSEPDLFAKGVVALVDIGFKHSTITMLKQGELVMNRVLTMGGDHITTALAESLGISHAEAEGIKIGMPGEVKANLETAISALGRELRASIDFFEHHQDLTVSQVFVSGGSAASEFIVHALQTELMVGCRTWNPVSSLQLSLPGEQKAGLEHTAPQLAVALGAAVAAL